MLNVVTFNKLRKWIFAGGLAIALMLMSPTSVLAVPSLLGAPHVLLAKNDLKPTAAVVLANRFTVSKEQIPDFLERWNAIGTYMNQQPGFISAELQKDILKPQEWVMSEQWKSLAAYKQAVSTDAFQALIQDFPGKATWFAEDLFPTR